MLRERNFGFSSETRKASKKPGSVAKCYVEDFFRILAAQHKKEGAFWHRSFCFGDKMRSLCPGGVNPGAPAFSTSLACNAEVVEVCARMRSLSWDEVAGKPDTVAAEKL